MTSTRAVRAVPHASPRARIAIVADSALAAARLEALLPKDVMGRVVIGSAAVVAAEHDSDVVVLAMSGAAATRALDTLASGGRRTPVIVLASPPHEAWTARGRRAGVRAVLRHDASAEELAAAIVATRAGLLTLHPDAVGAAARTTTSERSAATLTSRELEVLEMMAEGMSNRAIAGQLKISRHTVKFHVASLLTRLGVATRTEAVTAGVRRGLISI